MTTPTTSDEQALLTFIAASPDDVGLRLLYADALQARDEESAILYRIIHDPDNDDWRLQYASWLEQQGDKRVTCPKCEEDGEDREPDMRGDKCPNCKGTGTIFDTSRRDRAELIRVGCELERCKYLSDGRTHSLYNRESALLEAHPEWFPTCPALNHSHSAECSLCRNTNHVGTFRRGFLEELPVPTIGSVLEEMEYYNGHILLRTEWHPTDYGHYLYANFGTLRRIVAKDRVLETEHLTDGWCWYKLGGSLQIDDTAVLPLDVYDAASKYSRHPDSAKTSGVAFYDTAELANNAASTALCEVLWAKVQESQ